MRNWNRKTSSSKLSSVSISFSTAAKGNFNHNRRTNSKVPENVDPTRTAFNKILIDKDIRQVYKEVFGEALAEYNANQVAKKHPERQKKDYYSSICHDKKTEPFREAVVQIGNKDKQIPRWESNEILQKFLKKFQENNPQLVVVGAYIHNDEATPHMHIDYVPVATYSKGLKKRVSNDKALNQMGYKTWNDWKDSQMACLENLVREKGYDREYMNNSNRHIADVEQFKRVQKEVERQANNKLEKMELPDIPAPEIKINPINKSESVRFTKAEFEQIKQVINYQQIQITSLEAQKSTLNTDLEISKQTINRIKNKPYVLENETLTQNLQDESDFSEKLTKKYEKLNNQYIDLFKGYKKLEKENSSLHQENASQFSKIKELEMKISNITLDFHYRLTRAYVSIKNIVQAVGMLKYDKDEGYGIENITDKQERLIDGVSEYGSALAKENEYPELAKQMDQKVGIDESLKSFVKLPEPERTRESRSSRDWDIEL
mgnify:CR=1 FL=1